MSTAQKSIPISRSSGPSDLQSVAGTAGSAGSAGAALSHTDAVRLRRVQRMARWMDASMSIPGTPIRFGLDSVVGLIPGIGDLSTAAIGGWVLHQAHRAGVPKRQLAHMLANIAVDLTVGVVPVVGDLFDVYWKSNVRNARLLEAHLTKRSQ